MEQSEENFQVVFVNPNFYSLVFGSGESGKGLVKLLGLSPADFGRYRDAWVRQGRICVYTRNGGPNQEDYHIVDEAMSSHPLFEMAEDDDFDNTYRTYYFRFPPEYAEDLAKLPDEPSGDERWQAFLEALKSPPSSTDKKRREKGGPDSR